MEKNLVAWGLDIGHSSIKAVKVSRTGTGATVLGYAIEPIATGEEVDREEAVVKALEQLSTREEFGGLPVVASLSGRQIYAKTINIPVINPKKVDKMVELEARQQIPGNFDEVEWSYHLSPAADGVSNDVALFAAKRELIDEVVRKCKRVGINLVGVSVSSLALYNFVRFDQEFPDDETVIILDVGAENTDLVLYQGDTLWMRTLAVSGNDITKAFMKKFRVSFEEAETLKRQIGESRQADKIFKVIEGSLNELMGDVQRSLGFYKQTNPNCKLENIVISGNTFRLPNLPQFLADRLRFAVITLEDLERIQVAPGLDRAHFLSDLPSLGVATGLALQGVGVATAIVNLMPSQLRLQRILREKRWAGYAALIMVGATFLLNYSVVSSLIATNVGLTKQIKDEYEKNAEDEKKSREVLEMVGPLAQRLSSFDRIGTQKGISYAVMAGVFQVVQDLAIQKGPITVAGKAADGSDADPALQAIYLDKIDLPSPSSSSSPNATQPDPFRPLQEKRQVMVSVRIPRQADPEGTRQLVTDRLKNLPVPPYLKTIHGDRLFVDVQVAHDREVDDQYYWINEKGMDEHGNKAPTYLSVKVPMRVYDLTFFLPQEAAPPPPKDTSKDQKDNKGKKGAKK